MVKLQIYNFFAFHNCLLLLPVHSLLYHDAITHAPIPDLPIYFGVFGKIIDTPFDPRINSYVFRPLLKIFLNHEFFKLRGSLRKPHYRLDLAHQFRPFLYLFQRFKGSFFSSQKYFIEGTKHEEPSISLIKPFAEMERF